MTGTMQRCLLLLVLLAASSAVPAIQTHNALPGELLSGWFEYNRGQFAEQVQFINRFAGDTLFITDHCISHYPVNNSHNPARHTAGNASFTQLCLKGSHGNKRPQGRQTLPGKVNYLSGKPDNWHTGITRYKEMWVPEVYDGIDMRYYNAGNRLEFDFILAPGAAAENIQWQVSPQASIHRQADDSLLIVSDGDSDKLHLSAPVAYQLIDQRKITVASQFKIASDNTISVQLGAYDKHRPLIIDPVLSWSSYLGGSNSDYAFAVASDSSNNIYLAGYTGSSDIAATANAYQTQLGGIASAFVAKFSPPPQSQPLYITYVGEDVAEVRAMAVDSAGNAYVTGSTSSSNFPTVNAFQNSKVGIIDGYIFKLNAAGDGLVYSTYFGGNSVDRGRAIALDSAGNAYVTGVTASTNFPVLNAYQASNAGIQDAYVLKLASSGNALVYATYLGGTGGDYAAAITVDASGYAYLTGHTSSLDYPLVNAQQPLSRGNEEAIVSILNDQGELVYSSYLGGSDNDYGSAIDLDMQGNVYVAGSTQSADFPFLFASKPLAGLRDAFISRLNPTDIALSKSLLIGGDGQDSVQGLFVDASSDIHIGGLTTSANLPVVMPLQASNGGGTSDIFVNVLSMDSGSNKFMSYLGGSGGESLHSLWLSDNMQLLVAGDSDSGNYPQLDAYQAMNAGGVDAFVSVISLDADSDLVADYNDNCPDQYNPLQEDDNNNGIGNACEPPVITGFWPASASAGEFIFLFGSGFISGDTQVRVNNINVSLIQVVTSDMLIFVLPQGDTHGPVLAQTVHGLATSNTDFGGVLSGLSISGIWPGGGVAPGEFVFVFGSGFQYPISVSLGSINIPLVQVVNDDMLILLLPQDSVSAPLTINSQGQSVSSNSDLQVTAN